MTPADRAAARLADPDHDRPGASGAASAAIAAVLDGPRRPVRVIAAFPAAAYLAHDDGLIALVAGDGIEHPNAVVLGRRTASRPLATVHVGDRGTAGDGAIELRGLRVTVARWFDPVPRLRQTAPGLLAVKLAAARAHLVARTGSDGHELAGPTAAVVDALCRSEVAAAVAVARELVGAGPGLTPAGDDILAGLFAAVRTLGPAVDATDATATATDATAADATATDATATDALLTTVAAAGTAVVARAREATTAISAELLQHAARGEVATPAAGVLHAFTGRRPLAPALDTLLTVGATSGRDLTFGLIAGAELMLTAASPRTPCPSAATT